jgi:hypothetical protein
MPRPNLKDYDREIGILEDLIQATYWMDRKGISNLSRGDSFRQRVRLQREIERLQEERGDEQE